MQPPRARPGCDIVVTMRYQVRAAVFTLTLALGVALLASCYNFNSPYDPESPTYVGEQQPQGGDAPQDPPPDAPPVDPPPVQVPAAPTALHVTGWSGTEIALAWTDNSSDETGFRVEVREGTSQPRIDTVAADVTTHRAQGLKQSTAYTFRVQAYNDAGDSAWSDPVDGATSNGSVGTTG